MFRYVCVYVRHFIKVSFKLFDVILIAQVSFKENDRCILSCPSPLG